MVQIIDQGPSGLSRFLQRVEPSIEDIVSRFAEKKNRREEDEAFSKMGVDTKGIRDPHIRQKLLEGEMKKKEKAQEYDFDEKSYGTIKEAFGPKFADVWKASPTGARTALTQAAIEATKRGQNVRQLFEQMPEEAGQPEQRISGQEKINTFPDYKLPTKNMTPADVVKYKKELRGYNSPVLTESIKANKVLDTQLNAVKDLEKLNNSGKLPSGLSRVLIDPKTGNIRPIAQMLQLVPKEAEEYVKIINDFTTQAKDSFGARVTNFELDRFMKRLPILSNSEAGRELILQRMRVNAEAEKLYHKKLKEIYRHYGQDNITPEDADALAEQLTEEDSERLKDQGVQIDKEMDRVGSGKDKNQNVPEGMVLLLDPNGSPLHVPEDEVERLLSLGATRPK